MRHGRLGLLTAAISIACATVSQAVTVFDSTFIEGRSNVPAVPADLGGNILDSVKLGNLSTPYAKLNSMLVDVFYVNPTNSPLTFAPKTSFKIYTPITSNTGSDVTANSTLIGTISVTLPMETVPAKVGSTNGSFELVTTIDAGGLVVPTSFAMTSDYIVSGGGFADAGAWGFNHDIHLFNTGDVTESWLSIDNIYSSDEDFGFFSDFVPNTIIDATPTAFAPEPASLATLSAVAALAMKRRRRACRI